MGGIRRNTKELSIDILRSAENFSLENRMNQIMEEMAELIQAICKWKRSKENDKTLRMDEKQVEQQLEEEIADVEICLKQLKYKLCITEKVEAIKYQKVERTKQLLEEEQEEE